MSSSGTLIRRVRARLALVGAVEDLQRGLAWGAGTTLVALAARRLGWIEADASLCALGGASVAAIFTLLGVLRGRGSDLALASEADVRLGLRERLSTALWWQRSADPAAGAMGDLVVQDAETAAARVSGDAVRRAIRPRLRPRMLGAAVLFAAAGTGLVLWAGDAEAVVETDAERIARLADANRLAEVARKLRAETARVRDEAKKVAAEELAKVADQIHKKLEPLTRAPAPRREEALKQLNALADLAREQARRQAAMQAADRSEEASQEDRALEQLLADLNKAGLESLRNDLRDLEERLKADPKGDGAPTSEEVRQLAERVDALRRAMERADEAGAASMRAELRRFGNEELMDKIAQRLRELAARMDAAGANYQGLQSEDEMESLDLSEMSEEELQELLRQIEELSGLEDLEELMRQGGGELRGGRKIRLGGSGGT